MKIEGSLTVDTPYVNKRKFSQSIIRIFQPPKEDDVAMICYTSGTTGKHWWLFADSYEGCEQYKHFSSEFTERLD